MRLNIFSQICTDEDRVWLEYFGENGVSFSTVDDFISSIPEDDDTIDIRLNCNGGDVMTGWAIVDKLRATGKKITATIEGCAASMAVTILLAASERKAYKHASLLIHKPYFPYLGGGYNEDDLAKLQEQIHESTEKLVDFIAERTGTDKDKIVALMEEDKFINMETAKEYGFIHEILEPISASAMTRWPGMRNKYSKNMAKDNNEMSFARKAVAALASAFGLSIKMDGEEPKQKNYTLTTESGGEINVDIPEGQDPAVGDAASPDGSHKMPDGTTIVIADGKITEILPAESEDDKNNNPAPQASAEPEPQGDPEPAAPAEPEPAAPADPEPQGDPEPDPKDAEIAQLKAELEAARAQAKTEAEQTILDTVEKAGGETWLNGVAKSAYVVAQRKQKIANQTVTTSVENELNALKEKLAKQQK